MTRTSSNVGHPAWLERFGLVSGSVSRKFWVHGNDRHAFEAIGPTLNALRERFPRLELLVSAPNPALRQWLSETFADAQIVSPPWPIGVCVRRYMVGLRVRGLMLLGPRDHVGRSLIAAAEHRGAPVVLLTPPPSTSGAEDAATLSDPSDLQHVKHAFVATEAQRQLSIDRGLPAERVSTLSDDRGAWTPSILDVLDPLLTQDQKVARRRGKPYRQRMERLVAATMDSPFWRRLLAFKVQRIDTIEELRRELGNPRTILCLGNGPSSEGPLVEAQRFDCLFRVKHVWMRRGFLTGPDVVFTGTKASVSALCGPIFCLQTLRSEPRLLLTRFLMPWTGRVRYATAERFGLFLYGSPWRDVRPTNGAAMIATAVALQPDRLVISGIDLYSHPDGAYPGDSVTPNAYSPGHGIDTEVQLLVTALSQYRGELVILSDALAARWATHNAQATGPREAAAPTAGQA